MEALDKKQKIIIIVGVVIVAIVIIFYYINSTKELYGYEELNEVIETEEENTEDGETIIVHITGAVQNNGVVEVKENARINDVIEAAGGVTEDADLSNVNLAYKVEDGQKIYIPSVNDTTEETEDGEENIVNYEAGSSIISDDNTSQNETLININTATQSELETLPGIGSATATKIITYREENGKFKTIEEIKNVSRYRR